MKENDAGRGISFIDLPLNVLFQIVLQLRIEDIYNLAKTCKLLRLLANESIIYKHRLNECTISNQWTKRLLYDLFNIINKSRPVVEQIGLHHQLSVIGSIQVVQRKFKLGYDTNRKLVGSAVRNKADIINVSPETAKDTLSYLKILQGFHNISDMAENQDLVDVDKINKYSATVNTSSQDHSYSPEEFDISSIANSLIGSEYSKSPTNSVFSDAPSKLSFTNDDRNLSLSTPGQISETLDNFNHNSICDPLQELRMSKRVKDKAALFEKFFATDDFNNRPTDNKIPFNVMTLSNDGYNAIVSLPIMERNRPKIIPVKTVAKTYLEELERNSTAQQPHNTKREASRPTYSSLVTQLDNQSNVQRIGSPHNYLFSAEVNEPTPKHSKRKLKAIITDTNRISYENI